MRKSTIINRLYKISEAANNLARELSNSEWYVCKLCKKDVEFININKICKKCGGD